jgi:hypothetical protein
MPFQLHQWTFKLVQTSSRPTNCTILPFTPTCFGYRNVAIFREPQNLRTSAASNATYSRKWWYIYIYIHTHVLLYSWVAVRIVTDIVLCKLCSVTAAVQTEYCAAGWKWTYLYRTIAKENI